MEDTGTPPGVSNPIKTQRRGPGVGLRPRAPPLPKPRTPRDSALVPVHQDQPEERGPQGHGAGGDREAIGRRLAGERDRDPRCFSCSSST